MRSNNASTGNGEEAYKPQNLIPCFVMFIIGANMQRDACCSEFRLRDDTCVVWPTETDGRVNAPHLVQDMLPKLHQIREEWPHSCTEIWPAQLCAPGEEHYGSSLEAYVAAGEQSGKFTRRQPIGNTVFDAPDVTMMVREPAPSSSAAPMPRIPNPTLDDDSATWG